jgi:hypothetical protein
MFLASHLLQFFDTHFKGCIPTNLRMLLYINTKATRLDRRYCPNFIIVSVGYQMM